MSIVVGLDTQILFWGIEGKAKPHDLEMIPRAKNFLAELDKQKAQIYIPSVVIGEFLLAYPPQAHEALLQTFQKRFRIVSYDAAAAIHCARILQNVRPEILKAEVPEITRGMIRGDCQIIGSLLANGVPLLYSHDVGLAKISKGFLTVKEMPLTLAISEQENDEQAQEEQ